MVAHATLWEAEVIGSLSTGVRNQPGRNGETPSLEKKKKKKSKAWWYVPVIPAKQLR